MAARIEIQVNSRAVTAALRRMAERGGDFSGALDEIGASLVSSTVQRFRQGVSPSGEPWKPSRRAEREGGRTLVDSGRLRDSITHEVSGNSVSVGTNVVYAAIHQLGGTIRAKNAKGLAIPTPSGGVVFRQRVRIPARPFLGVSEADREEIAEISIDHLTEPFE